MTGRSLNDLDELADRPKNVEFDTVIDTDSGKRVAENIRGERPGGVENITRGEVIDALQKARVTKPMMPNEEPPENAREHSARALNDSGTVSNLGGSLDSCPDTYLIANLPDSDGVDWLVTRTRSPESSIYLDAQNTGPDSIAETVLDPLQDLRDVLKPGPDDPVYVQEEGDIYAAAVVDGKAFDRVAYGFDH